MVAFLVCAGVFSYSKDGRSMSSEDGGSTSILIKIKSNIDQLELDQHTGRGGEGRRGGGVMRKEINLQT